ncbi:hypothetical protein EKE94_18090 [Mesobaculum littorinae]|uniref:Peptidoglycan binding-like domain-containing protein n=1 Tax=Mesobaculum littorinae TaxID=2486419 RepID=A0A438AD03_9RHOB|nr:peptidoglycan-binding protein [Mesobaculum littorinae]RVV96557.1 hypothetical protein EKE94_18090 [Mesobaculum littorinae]
MRQFRKERLKRRPWGTHPLGAVSRKIRARIPRCTGAGLVAALGLLAGCGGGDPTTLALRTMRPDAAPVRNLTSFGMPLHCMDGLLAASGRPRVTLSSSDIPDLTRKLPVGADDMLINAISQMNRSSGTYVFLDQTHVRGTGINVIVAEDPKKNDPRPDYYIRGSISQVDRGVHGRETGIGVSPTEIDSDVLGAVGVSGKRTLSVVSVDLHLVDYDTRAVLPGASVANSMVVVGRSWTAGAAGLINLRPFDLTLEISRLESESQAVRNLIELGVIELLGKHARVPYHTCLAQGMTRPLAARASDEAAARAAVRPFAGAAAPAAERAVERDAARAAERPAARAAARAAERVAARPGGRPGMGSAPQLGVSRPAARQALPKAAATAPAAPAAKASVPQTSARQASAPQTPGRAPTSAAASSSSVPSQGPFGAPSPPPAAVPALPEAEVRALQTALVILGYLPRTTGRFDSATRGALARFQQGEGLIASGLPVGDTQARLRLRLAGAG